MSKEKIVKMFFFILLFGFLVLLFAESNGYYQTKATKTKILTEEQIKQFEEDIKEGKDIDLSSYITEEKSYTSKLSNNIYKISLKLEKGIDKTIKSIFKAVNNAIED